MNSPVLRFSKLLLPFWGFSIFIFISFVSCRKADRDTDTTTSMITDNSFSNFFFSDIFKQVHQFALSDSSMNSLGSYFISDTICLDAVSHVKPAGVFPDTIILNFGPENGAACADGNFRSGKLKITCNGRYGSLLKNFSVSPENYYLNKTKVEGKMDISCRGKNSAQNLYFTVKISGGEITNDSMRLQYYSPDSGQTATLQYEWITGSSTATVGDDAFQITGSYGGITSKGTTYKGLITGGLKYQTDCKWIISGTEKITPLNLSPREVDYGSGCDNKCKVTINGKDVEVNLLP